MKIAHIVNLVDRVGSYGGPLRVAANQVAELAGRGHDAVLLAGADGKASADRRVGEASARLWRSIRVSPAGGFATRWAPGLHAWLAAHARSFDIVHVHLGRDLTTSPAAVLVGVRGVPYVVQTHGMVDPSARRLAKVLDRVTTRRVVAGSRRVLVLTDQELGDVEQVMAGRPFHPEVVPNGVSLPPVRASAPTYPPEALFLSRLHERKRPVLFAEAALRLRAEGVRARFTLVGPDEGELAAVRAVLARLPAGDLSVSYEGAVPMDASGDRLARASVFVLPSVAEPFPMVVLEAMSASVPVVCSVSCGLAPWVAQARAGEVVPNDDLDALADAVRHLLESPADAAERGRRGRELVSKRFSIAAIAARLEEIYSSALDTSAELDSGQSRHRR